jgi:serine phosphatase RsbU (regulator of sigma subunit)
MATLPATPPAIPGYELAGVFLPTDDTGGDTYDFVPCADGSLFVLMGDATGHGIGPALSATQVRAMLRLAERLGPASTSLPAHQRPAGRRLAGGPLRHRVPRPSRPGRAP